MKLQSSKLAAATVGESLTPRRMRSAQVREKRRAMLNHPHVADLTRLAESLRVGGEVPDFGPFDGGVAAEVLFLFEKLGPMASGSGFISHDNDDPTEDAALKFTAQAGLVRERTVTWNIITWWNGTVKNEDRRASTRRR